MEFESVVTEVSGSELQQPAHELVVNRCGDEATQIGYAVGIDVVAAAGQSAGTPTYSSVVAIRADGSDAKLAAVDVNTYEDASIRLRTWQLQAKSGRAIDVTRESLQGMTSGAKRTSLDIILRSVSTTWRSSRTMTDGFTMPDEPFSPKPPAQLRDRVRARRVRRTWPRFPT